LPFSSSWLEKEFGKNIDSQMIELIKYNNVTAYPALIDKPNTYTSQDEHTIMIKENKSILLC
jgi:methionine aminopeptidase